MKRFLKEFMITILLCIALILIFAIVFYEYIPINKSIPEPVNYTMPSSLSEVKNELESSADNEDEKIIVTYDVEESDLASYKKQGSYKEGKADPFGQAPTEDENNSTSNGTANGSSSTTSTNQSSNTINKNTTSTKDKKENPDDTGTFFEEPGTK